MLQSTGLQTVGKESDTTGRLDNHRPFQPRDHRVKEVTHFHFTDGETEAQRGSQR